MALLDYKFHWVHYHPDKTEFEIHVYRGTMQDLYNPVLDQTVPTYVRAAKVLTVTRTVDRAATPEQLRLAVNRWATLKAAELGHTVISVQEENADQDLAI